VPYYFVTSVKARFKYDDALDTFGVHAVGGTLGAFLTGLLATAAVNGNLTSGAAVKNGLATLVTQGGLWHEQLKAMGITLLLSVIATVIIASIVRMTIGLRPAAEIERQGLDLAEHGEEGYIE
jgi:Amt family ammonium transporter